MYELGVPVKYTYRETEDGIVFTHPDGQICEIKSNLGGNAVALNRSEKNKPCADGYETCKCCAIWGKTRLHLEQTMKRLFLGNQQLPSARAISTFRTKSIPVMLAFLFLCPMP